MDLKNILVSEPKNRIYCSHFRLLRLKQPLKNYASKKKPWEAPKPMSGCGQTTVENLDATTLEKLCVVMYLK